MALATGRQDEDDLFAALDQGWKFVQVQKGDGADPGFEVYGAGGSRKGLPENIPYNAGACEFVHNGGLGFGSVKLMQGAAAIGPVSACGTDDDVDVARAVIGFADAFEAAQGAQGAGGDNTRGGEADEMGLKWKAGVHEPVQERIGGMERVVGSRGEGVEVDALGSHLCAGAAQSLGHQTDGLLKDGAAGEADVEVGLGPIPDGLDQKRGGLGGDIGGLGGLDDPDLLEMVLLHKAKGEVAGEGGSIFYAAEAGGVAYDGVRLLPGEFHAACDGLEDFLDGLALAEEIADETFALVGVEPRVGFRGLWHGQVPLNCESFNHSLHSLGDVCVSVGQVADDWRKAPQWPADGDMISGMKTEFGPGSSGDTGTLLFHAVEVSAAAHRGERRKVNASPYLGHALGVAEHLLAHGVPEYPVVIAALLHDTVEHRKLTLEYIDEEFGGQVAELVRAVTDAGPGRVWEERKQGTIDGLRSAPDAVLLLACADKLDNLLSLKQDMARLGDVVWRRMGRSKDEMAWYFGSLGEIFWQRAATSSAPMLLHEYCSELTEVFGV